MNQGPPAMNRLLHFSFALFADHKEIDQTVDFALDRLVRDGNLLGHRVPGLRCYLTNVQSAHQPVDPCFRVGYGLWRVRTYYEWNKAGMRYEFWKPSKGRFEGFRLSRV